MKFFVVVLCPPISVVNGQVKYKKSSVNYYLFKAKGSLPLDTVATMWCNYAFYRSGPSTSICQTSGKWNQQPPTCHHCNKNNVLIILLFTTL